MPAEGLAWLPKEEILTFEELTRLLGIFVGLGVRSIKVTGGEPTVRADLPTLVRMFREVGPRPRHLHHDERRAAGPPRGAARRRRRGPRDGQLRLAPAAPVRRDDPPRRARQGPGGPAGRRGRPVSRPIKINVVVIGGTNDDEVVDFARWSRETGYEVRFIEYMPLDAEHAWERAKVVPPARASSRRSTPCTRCVHGHRRRAGHDCTGSPTARRARSA